MKALLISALIAIQGFLGIGNGQTLGGTVLTVPQGGTGATSFTVGECLVGNGTGGVTTQSCSAGGGEANTGVSLGTGLNIFDSKSGVALRFNSIAAGTNVTLSTTTNDNTIVISSTGGSGTSAFEIATTSNIAVPEIAYFTKTAGRTTLGSVATTTVTATLPLSLSNTVWKVGGSNSVLSLDTTGTWSGNAGTASALAANGSNCSPGSLAGGVSASGVAEDCTDVWTEAENTSAGYTSNTGTVTNIATTWPILGGPITTTGTLTFGGLSTSSAAVIGNIPYFSGVNTFANVATSSVTINAPLTSAGTPGYVVGGSGWTLDIDNIKAADLDLTDITLNDFTNDAGFLTSYTSPFEIATSSNIAVPQLLYVTKTGGRTTVASVSTTTASCSGDATCSSFTVIGDTPIDISATAGAGAVDGTGVAGMATYWVDSNTVGATSTLSVNNFVATSSSAVSVFPLANITKLSNLTSNGFVKTGSGDGTLSVDTTTYESGLTAGDGLTRTLNDFDCDTASGSVFGCLTSTDWTTFNNKLTALGSGYATTTQSAIAFSTTTQTFNGLTIAQRIIPSAGALTFTPNISGTLDNTGLTNSSITLNGSSVSLGGSLTVSSTTLLADHNSWSGVNRFGNASSTYHSFGTASSTQWVGGGLQECNATTGKLNWNATTLQFKCDTDQNTGGGGSDPFTHFSGVNSATTTSMAIGSTTAPFLSQLTVSSTTAPQLSLSAGAGVAQWAFRNAGGNLYLSTTTVDGTATTSTSILSLLSSGVASFVDALKLLIPWSTDPTLDTKGQIAINTTTASSSVRIYDGTAERALYDTVERSFFMSTSTLLTMKGLTGTSTVEMRRAYRPQTLVAVSCTSTTTGTAFLDFGDGTNWTNLVTCNTTGSWTSMTTNNTFTMGEMMKFRLGTQASIDQGYTISYVIRNDPD